MRRRILWICGFLLLALGAVGIAIPVLPTTPFVLLASGCFSASSPRIFGWLHRNRFFGPYIEHYKNKTGVSKAAKIRGIVAVWLLLSLSAAHLQQLWSTLLLGLIGTAVTVHLLMLRTRIEPPPLVKVEAEGKIP